MVLCPRMSKQPVGEQMLKREKNCKKQVVAKNSDLLDWVLAIDACIR